MTKITATVHGTPNMADATRDAIGNMVQLAAKALVDPAPQHFVLLGGGEHLPYFLNNDDWNQYEWFWTVPKSAKKGDLAFIYLTAPVSAIVGRVELVEEPWFHVDGFFDNPKMKNKQVARIGNVTPLTGRTDLTMKSLRTLFGRDWPWLGYPRSHVRIPADILPPFLELINQSTASTESTTSTNSTEQ